MERKEAMYVTFKAARLNAKQLINHSLTAKSVLSRAGMELSDAAAASHREMKLVACSSVSASLIDRGSSCACTPAGCRS
jgi:hypothetical protein